MINNVNYPTIDNRIIRQTTFYLDRAPIPVFKSMPPDYIHNMRLAVQEIKKSGLKNNAYFVAQTARAYNVKLKKLKKVLGKN